MNQNLFFTDTAWGTKIDVSGENLNTTYNPFTSENFNIPSDALIRFEFGPNIGYGYVIGADKRIYNPIVNGTIQQAFLSVDDVDEITRKLTDDEINNYVKVTGIAVTANNLTESQSEWVEVKEEDEWVEVKEEDEWVEVKEEDEWVEVKEEDEWVEVKEEDEGVEVKEEDDDSVLDVFSRLKEATKPSPIPSSRVTESRLGDIFNRLQEANGQINESRNVKVVTFEEFSKELAIKFPDDSDIKNLNISGFSKVTFVTPKDTINARMVEGALTFVAFENKNNKLIAYDDGEFKELLQVTEFVKVHK